MIRRERILILKYLNAAYRMAYNEEAAATQNFLSKLVYFLRYYLNDEVKIVRLQDELAYLQVFIEVYRISAGKSLPVSYDFTGETLESDLPSKLLVTLVQEILFALEEQGTETSGFIISGFLEQTDLVIKVQSFLINGNSFDTTEFTGVRANFRPYFTSATFNPRENSFQVTLRRDLRSL